MFLAVALTGTGAKNFVLLIPKTKTSWKFHIETPKRIVSMLRRNLSQ